MRETDAKQPFTCVVLSGDTIAVAGDHPPAVPHGGGIVRVANRSLLALCLAGVSTLSMLDLSGEVAAGLFLVVALVLLAISKRDGFVLSAAMLVVVAYVLAYPLEVLFYEFYSRWGSAPLDSLDFSTLWALRGFCAFSVAYAVVVSLSRNRNRELSHNGEWVRGQISYTVYILTAIGWLAVLSWVLSVAVFGISLTFVEGKSVNVESAAGTLQQALGLMSALKQPFLFGFLVLYYKKLTDRHLTFLFWCLVGISVVEIVTIGSKASIIRGIVVVLLVGAVLPIRLNLRQAAIGAGAVMVFYAAFLVITEYRALILAEHDAGGNVFDITVQAEAFGRALLASAPFDDAYEDRETEVKANTVLSRLGHATTFSDLLEHTGRTSPYEHAWESVFAPLYAVLPRFILPDKPEFFHSGRNAAEYYGWRYGGISVTLLGSLYFAWGYVGIVLGMACMGGWLAFVEAKARRGNILSPHWLILLAMTAMMLLDVGVAIQPIVTDLLRVALILWMLHLLYPSLRTVMQRRTSRILTPDSVGQRT